MIGTHGTQTELTTPARRWQPTDIDTVRSGATEVDPGEQTGRCWARVEDPANRCHVRGVLIRRVHSYLASLSEDRVQGVLDRLDADDRAFLGSVLNVKVARWYPFPLIGRLLEAVHDELHTIVEEPAFELGRFHSRMDTCALFSPLFKYGRTQWLADGSAAVWGLFHSRGRVECTTHDGPVVVSRVIGHPEVHELHCEATRGFVVGALEAATGMQFEIEHTHCRARGADTCTFVTQPVD